MRKIFLASIAFFIAFCLAGCGKPRFELNVASMPNVNPDNSGRPSPVVVKTYELRSDLAFKQADFQSLFERPAATLGADLIAADELVFVPGEARKIAYKPGANTRFLGLVAGFRQMDRARWRVIKAVNPEEKNIIALEFNDTSILAIPDKQAKDWEPEEAVKEFQRQIPRQTAPDASDPGAQPPSDAPKAAAPPSASNAPESSGAPVRAMRPLD